MSEPEPSPIPRPRSPARRGFVSMILQYTRGLVFDQHLRRQTMFYMVLGAMFMFLVGDVILAAWLRENLARFVVWWLVCGWLTIGSALLAMYDLLLLRVQHRLARRELRERLLKRADELKRMNEEP